jgi:CDP-glucose 4,6-dehydratase
MDLPCLFLLDFERSLAGRKILVTGHTGFTGSWACLWLKSIGAEVAGFALAPETDPSLFVGLGLEQDVKSVLGDIRDYESLAQAVKGFQPQLVLHLAAQPLVRRSYREPLSTFATNAGGTAHVLEAVRHVSSAKAVVCVTTDKVYKNNEWPWSYRENDPLGGKDPYSASKAAAEMVIQSYSASFGTRDGQGLAIAAARGGNIIGGGDWSEDRLIPDFVRAVVGGGTLTLRYPEATRPWQHVLALVQGYLMLLSALSENPGRFARAWNFGPHDPRAYSVREVVDLLSNIWTRPNLEFMEQPMEEARALSLDSSLARNVLDWIPAWDTRRVIAETAAWYRGYYQNHAKAREISMGQLLQWRETLKGAGK